MRHSVHRGSTKGFSLLEILLVLVVLALAAALILPALIQPVGTQLRTAAASFAAGLRQARNDAVNTHREVLFTVHLDAREFVIGDGARRRRVPAQVALSVFTARSEVLDEHSAAIRFFADGSSTGGRVTLSAGDRRYHVDVDWMTGQVRVRAEKPQDKDRGRDPLSGRVRLDS
jgi:general secretion pathway protein H